MRIMPQSTDPERLNNEDSKGDTWVFLGRGNRKNFASALGAVVNGNRRDRVAGEWREKVLGETTGTERHLRG